LVDWLLSNPEQQTIDDKQQMTKTKTKTTNGTTPAKLDLLLPISQTDEEDEEEMMRRLNACF